MTLKRKTISNNLSVLFFITCLLGSCTPQVLYTSKHEGAETKKYKNKTRSNIQSGVASYYADKFHGRKTSNGETYNMNAFTAAHPTLPFGTRVTVTNVKNSKSVTLRINDRGPFVKNRIIDVSLAAAKQLDMLGTGTAEVTIEVLETGK